MPETKGASKFIIECVIIDKDGKIKERTIEEGGETIKDGNTCE